MKAAAALLATLLTAPALAAPGAGDVNRAATRAAQILDGVLRGCPANFARVGTADKRCVGVRGTVEEARVRLGDTLERDLYGVWRSRDEQRSVYNWLRTPGGYVYLRLQPDPEGRAQTLVYLDLPPESAARSGGGSGGGNVSVTPGTRAPGTATPGTGAPNTGASSTRPAPAPRTVTPRPAPSPRATTPAAPATRTPAPAAPSTAPSTGRTLARVPFSRALGLQDARLNGEDVRAVQDRLIALTRPSGGGRGDGWYGPVTAATVRAFQAANGLPATGRVDRATWDLLFSPQARTFSASSIR